MPIQELPDPIEAMITYLLEIPEFTDVVGQQVADGLDESWPMPSKAVILRTASGPQGTPSSYFFKSRVDVLMYGKDTNEAFKVWRILDPCICPGQDRISGFKRAGCRIDDISRERSVSVGIEPVTNFPRATCSYIVTWLGLPV
jgi:hypothetical protein